MTQLLKVFLTSYFILLFAIDNVVSAQNCTRQNVNLSSFNGQSDTQSVFANNTISIGTSRILVTHPVGSNRLTTDRISDTHYPGEHGLNLGHNGNANSFLFGRIETQLAFSNPIKDIRFTINDLDHGDQLRILAYDENNNLLSITSGNYSFYPNTQVRYVGPIASLSFTGEFRSSSSDIDSGPSGARRGTIDFSFPNESISRIVFQYYDIVGSGSGSYSIAKLSGIDGACSSCNAGTGQVLLNNNTYLTNQ